MAAQPQECVQSPVAMAQCSHQQRRAVAARASKLGDVSLFSADSSSLLGGPQVVEDTKGKPKLDEVPLESEVRRFLGPQRRGSAAWCLASLPCRGSCPSGALAPSPAAIETFFHLRHPTRAQVGMDYTALRDALKEGDFRKADDETRALLIRLAGEGAVKRGWVYFTEVRTPVCTQQ